MDGATFDRVVQRLQSSAGRRAVLATLAAAGLAASPDLTLNPVAAKKKKKKVTICRGGQTLSVTKKKKQNHLKPGDTVGPCPATTPRPTTTLPPRCPAAKPNYCANLDACQPACLSGHAFDPESCACICAPATTCCYCNCQSGPVQCFPDGIANEGACRAACASSCQESPETVTVSFAGGNGAGATCDFTNDRCNVTCTAEPMICPAALSTEMCPAGQSCCLDEDGGGCCVVDSPVCCSAGCCGRGGVCCEDSGGCCSDALPLCCGSICCRADSACCEGDGDCRTGQVCAINPDDSIGCCIDNPGRSRGSRVATMMPATPQVPRRHAAR